MQCQNGRLTMLVERPGTSLVKRLTPFWERYHRPWKNVAPRLQHCFVSLNDHVSLKDTDVFFHSGLQRRNLEYIQCMLFQHIYFTSFLNFSQHTSRKDIEDIQYITFLLMARQGLRALEFYDPKRKKHGQAHMQAR